MRHRVEVEVAYLIALADWGVPELAGMTADHRAQMQGWVANFDDVAMARIKELERTTNHDVKAVEYWLKEQMAAAGMGEWAEFVHFGLTSQDVNNTAVPLSLKRATQEVLRPRLAAVRDALAQGALEGGAHARPDARPAG
jgi:adenylosuccinate lyase